MSEGAQGFAPPADNRPKYTFTIPDVDRVYATDPKTVTLVPLRVSDENDAAAVAMAARGSGAMLLSELVRRSVIAVDGRQVSWDGAGAEWYEKTSPKVRKRVIAAYGRVNDPDEDATKDFLATMTVST